MHPDRAQEQVLTRWGQAARTLWNIALEQRT
ncbi:helix-turn-helix domain-containing protein [Streptomyces sp. NPDC002205]